MLPVSITAILIRIIFKLKLADIIINVTSGGPGGATDSVTSFIFREYRSFECRLWNIFSYFLFNHNSNFNDNFDQNR